ncbi:orf f (apicoplast) [Cystoisospora suis]|uniref:Orf f n=1 Tax=Cystoisospora suis TaxID=483139 RepID=A0A2C6KMZ7_9APIC|nr:orf f [Cystoisospora suis]
MICLNILKFKIISKKYFIKKLKKKNNFLFNNYKKYLYKIFIKYYYIGFLSYKTTNFIILS